MLCNHNLHLYAIHLLKRLLSQTFVLGIDTSDISEEEHEETIIEIKNLLKKMKSIEATQRVLDLS